LECGSSAPAFTLETQSPNSNLQVITPLKSGGRAAALQKSRSPLVLPGKKYKLGLCQKDAEIAQVVAGGPGENRVAEFFKKSVSVALLERCDWVEAKRFCAS